MLKPGSNAPEFVLPDQDGRDVELTALLDNGPLILFFYPADYSPICTREVCMLRDMYADLGSVGLQVAGISPQDADSHRRFRVDKRLPYTLLADEDKVVTKMYDVDGPFGVGVRRTTYLINPDRKIQDAVQADMLLSRHEDFLKKAIVLREAAGLREGRFDEP